MEDAWTGWCIWLIGVMLEYSTDWDRVCTWAHSVFERIGDGVVVFVGDIPEDGLVACEDESS